MTFRDATTTIRRIIENSCEGGFYRDEKIDLDNSLARISVASKYGGAAAVLLTEIRGRIRSLSSHQGMRKYGGKYEIVRNDLLTALETLESLVPMED